MNIQHSLESCTPHYTETEEKDENLNGKVFHLSLIIILFLNKNHLLYAIFVSTNQNTYSIDTIDIYVRRVSAIIDAI